MVIGTEDSDAGFSLDDNVLTVATQHNELAKRNRSPMDHGADVRSVSATYRAWDINLSDSKPLPKERHVSFQWKHKDSEDSEPGALRRVDSHFIPVRCGYGFGWVLASNQLRCGRANESPLMTLAGSRMMFFQIVDTQLKLGENDACSVDLNSINPDAKTPLLMDIVPRPEDYPLPRFMLSPISETSAYLVDLSKPEVSIFLVDCSHVNFLKNAFTDEEVKQGEALNKGNMRVQDVIPDGEVNKVALLRSWPKNENLYRIDVKRNDGARYDVVRVTEDSPYYGDIIGPPGGFYGRNPAKLLEGARVFVDKDMTSIVITHYDVASQKASEQTFKIPTSS